MTNFKAQISNQVRINKFPKLLDFRLWVLFVILILTFGFSRDASAQATPEFLVSWRALNYIPAHYQGKALPSNSTPIEISFDLIDQNKIVTLSRNEISWSVNGRTIRSGPGLKNLRLNANSTDQTVRITVFDYKGADLDKIFTIPSVKPEIVLDIKATGKTLGLGNYTFSALPFFFNVQDINELAFNWTVNGQAASGTSENPNLLNLNLSSQDIPQETELTINVLARKNNNDLEFGGKRLNLIVR